MARTRLVAGNWKMHGSRAANRALLEAIVEAMGRGAECAVCVPFPYLQQVSGQLAGTALAWGAQNVSEHAQGAYTGEVSAAMLAAKFAAAQGAGLVPILCVGETLAERDAGLTEEVVARQLDAVLSKGAFSDAVLAYEPVWAIGTGRTATPHQAQAVHAFLRKKLSREVRILYGGSVKPGNAAALFAMPDIDGGLIGGASLVAQEFLAIVEVAAKG